MLILDIVVCNSSINKQVLVLILDALNLIEVCGNVGQEMS